MSRGSGGQKSEMKGWAGLVPSEAGKENLFLAPSLSWLSGGLRWSLAYRHISLVPAFVAT